ncbi:hypothetical protein AAVH_18171 [Aphelenchoides avenae]|nr:hypothetical protein AAVH_18171 [Aphelenchus avenae]
MRSPNASASDADAVKWPRQKSPNQVAQGASSDDGGRPEDPAPLTPPPNLQSDEHPFTGAHKEPGPVHSHEKETTAPDVEAHGTARDGSLPFQPETPSFWDTQRVRHAGSLEFTRVPANLALRAADVARWLNDRPAKLTENEPRLLWIKEADLREPVLALYGKLRELFLAAKEPAPYVMGIKMRQPVYYMHVFTTVYHPSTGERLAVQPEIKGRNGVVSGADLMDNPSTSLVFSRSIVPRQVLALEEEFRALNLLPQ